MRLWQAGGRILTDEIAVSTHPDAEDETSSSLALLTLILGAILVARIVGLVFSATDLHYEEAQNWYWAQSQDFTNFAQPPALLWLIGLMTTICGDGEICIRLPSPIIATLSAGLVYGLARHLYDARVAFWAAIVYATLPAVSTFAMPAMPQSILALFVTAALLSLSIHFERPTLLSGAAVGMILGLGVVNDTEIIYLPICSVFFIIMTPPLRRVLRASGTWVAVLTAPAIVLAGFLWSGRSEFADFSDVLPAGLAFTQINADAILVFFGLQFVLFGPILFFVLLRSVVARRTLTPRPTADRFLLFHSVPVFVALMVYAILFEAKAHWTFSAFPAAAIFVTALLLRHEFRRLLFVSTGLHVALLAGIIGFSVFADRFSNIPSFNRLVGWQDFAKNLAEAAAVSDLNTVVLRSGNQIAEANYYLRGQNIEILAFSPRGRRPDNDFEMLHSWAYGDPQPILLATAGDPSAFGIPLGTADKIGEFQVQSYLSSMNIFSLYRVNPPSETQAPR